MTIQVRNNMEIRRCLETDIPEILELLYELGRPKPKNSIEKESFRHTIEKYISDSDKEIMVAVDDGKIFGMISMMILPRLNHATAEMYVPELVVSEKYRGKGVGKKLINSCILLSKSRKCHRIRLESGNVRKESHKFYEHLGFEQKSLSFSLNSVEKLPRSGFKDTVSFQ